MQNADESSHAGRIAVAGVVVLAVLAIAAYSAVGLRNERNRAEELASTNQSLRDSLTRLQDQLQSVTRLLDTMAEPKAPPPLAQPKAASVKRTKARAKASNANDLLLKQMQDRNADQ